MCLIIDANMICGVLSAQPTADCKPLKEALFRKKAAAVYGGELTREYSALTRFRGFLIELDRIGSLRKINDAEVEAETTKVSEEGLCLSDDQHIIALARVAKVRLLCSHDQNLHADFTNRLILQPRGSVYQRSSHVHLIRRHCKRSNS
jgi:hypothetical protein